MEPRCGLEARGSCGSSHRGKGITLTSSELNNLRDLSKGIQKRLQTVENDAKTLAKLKKEADERVSTWYSTLLCSRKKRLEEKQRQLLEREQRQQQLDKLEEERRVKEWKETVDKINEKRQRDTEDFRIFQSAQLVGDTIAGLEEQQKWKREQRCMEDMREAAFRKEQEEQQQKLIKKEEEERSALQARRDLAKQTIIQQIQEVDARKRDQQRLLQLEAQANKALMEKEKLEAEKAAQAKVAQMRLLCEEIIKANEEQKIQRERQKIEQRMEEEAAAAKAEQLHERKLMIERQQVKCRLAYLENAQKLIDRQSAQLAALHAVEAERERRRAEEWERHEQRKEEEKRCLKAEQLRDLKQSRKEQQEAKRLAKIKEKQQDAAYIATLRSAAAEAERREKELQHQRAAARVQVRLEQQRQAEERREQRLKERQQRHAEEREEIRRLQQEDRDLLGYAQRCIDNAKQVGNPTAPLEIAKRIIEKKRILTSPPQKLLRDEDEIPTLTLC